MVECNQKHVIESVTQFLEKVRNFFDGSFNIKCESGKVTIYPYLLFLDARKKVEEKIPICVSIIRQKHPRGRKNRRVNYEGIGFEQRDTEP